MQYPWPLPQAQDSAAAVIQADGPNKKTAPVLKPEVAGKQGKHCRGVNAGGRGWENIHGKEAICQSIA